MNSTTRYKVLWFDDEHENGLDHIHEKARDAGIELVGYANAEEGMKELERNHVRYDAVLLDALFHTSAGMTGSTHDETALMDVRRKLDEMKGGNIILPWFVLSGQTSIIDGSNGILSASRMRHVYDKNDDAQIDQLWVDIKKKADERPNAKVRQRYRRVFEVCNEAYIGEAAANEFLKILPRDDGEMPVVDAKAHLNTVRKIVEDLFRACNREGLLPDDLVRPTMRINECSKLLGGTRVDDHELPGKIVPAVIGRLLRHILSVAQEASHRLEIDRHMAEVDTPYLLYASTYELMDVLLWFKGFTDDRRAAGHTRVLFEKGKVPENEEHVGVLEKDASGHFHCGEHFILSSHITADLKVGDRVVIKCLGENKNPDTISKYPKRGKPLRKA